MIEFGTELELLALWEHYLVKIVPCIVDRDELPVFSKRLQIISVVSKLFGSLYKERGSRAPFHEIIGGAD